MITKSQGYQNTDGKKSDYVFRHPFILLGQPSVHICLCLCTPQAGVLTQLSPLVFLKLNTVICCLSQEMCEQCSEFSLVSKMTREESLRSPRVKQTNVSITHIISLIAASSLGLAMAVGLKLTTPRDDARSKVLVHHLPRLRLHGN